MCLNVNCGAAQENIKWQKEQCQAFAFAVDGQHHAKSADAHMRTGKGCCWAFAGFFGEFNKSVKKTVGIPWRRQTLLMTQKIVAQWRKNTIHGIAHPYSPEVIGRSGYGQEDEYEII